ncbi:MAG: hypothetical protein M0Z82_17080 [Actinomycetota bacterium]|jgi:hypothetical protein|nr:hypothetical protein [Actinomycetota bacterium]
MAMTSEDLRRELLRHASFDGTVPPQVIARVADDGPWDGRMWEVLQIVAADHDRMAFLAGGLLPGEVADCVERWTESPLDVPDIAQIVDAGSYDPDPFSALVSHGLLQRVLLDADGQVRRVDGELVGRWISDQFADADDTKIVAWAEQLVS